MYTAHRSNYAPTLIKFQNILFFFFFFILNFVLVLSFVRCSCFLIRIRASYRFSFGCIQTSSRSGFNYKSHSFTVRFDYNITACSLFLGFTLHVEGFVALVSNRPFVCMLFAFSFSHFLYFAGIF